MLLTESTIVFMSRLQSDPNPVVLPPAKIR